MKVFRLYKAFAVFEPFLGKNTRHKKEVAGLVSGVESGVSKERLCPTVQLPGLAVCAPTHRAADHPIKSYVC